MTLFKLIRSNELQILSKAMTSDKSEDDNKANEILFNLVKKGLINHNENNALSNSII